MKVCLLFVLEDAEEAAFRASVGGSGWRAFRVAVQKSWRDGLLDIHAQPGLKPLGLVGCRFGTLGILYGVHSKCAWFRSRYQKLARPAASNMRPQSVVLGRPKVVPMRAPTLPERRQEARARARYRWGSAAPTARLTQRSRAASVEEAAMTKMSFRILIGSDVNWLLVV
jgi:hypothetical protein